MRVTRASRYIRSSGSSREKPMPPWIWMASASTFDGRHRQLIKERRGGMGGGRAIFLLDLAHFKAGELLLESEGGDPAARAKLAVVVGEDDKQVGERAVGDPHLAAVEHPLV